jgi:hypothetical protein
MRSKLDDMYDEIDADDVPFSDIEIVYVSGEIGMINVRKNRRLNLRIGERQKRLMAAKA